jgi:hypothetical protein
VNAGVTYTFVGRVYDRQPPAGFLRNKYKWRLDLKPESGRWRITGFETIYAEIGPSVQKGSKP